MQIIKKIKLKKQKTLNIDVELKSIQLHRFLAISIVMLFVFSTVSYALYDTGGQYHSSALQNPGFKSSVLNSSESSFFQVNQTLVLSNNSLVNGNYTPSNNSYEPFGVLYDKYNGNLYVSDSNKNQVTVINGTDNNVVTTIPVLGDRPEGLTLDTINHEIYVALEYSNDVAIINTTSESVQGNITGISTYPWALAFDPVNGYIYVAEEYYSTINVYNQTGVQEHGAIQLPYDSGTPIGPEGVTYDPANGNLYVDNTHFSNVSVINTTTNTVETSISVGKNPAGSFYDPSNQNIYVLGSSSNNVSVINGSTDKVTSSFKVGAGPQFGTYDPENNYLYISNFGSNNVTVVNPVNNSEVGSIDVGDRPYQISYDNLNNNIYLANDFSSTVSIIHSFPLVEFKETGLPAGGKWTVSIGTQTFSSTGDSISVYEPTGRYSYSVSGIGGYNVTNKSGTFSVNNSFVTINVGFAPQKYRVTFMETGLPSGTPWFINSTEFESSGPITAKYYNISLANTEYSYTASSENRSYLNPITETLIVDGYNQTVLVNFTKNAFTVRFIETGLPTGTAWVVDLNGINSTSRTGSITFTVPNGNYNYVIKSVSGYSPTKNGSGKITVNNQSQSLNVTWNQTFSLYFEESGLPSGSKWTVTVGEFTNTSSTGIIVIDEVNGTHKYVVSTTLTNYFPDSSSGNISINGKPENYTIVFYKEFSTVYNGSGIAITPNGSMAYVADTLGKALLKFNLQEGKLVGEINLTFKPLAIAITPNGSYAYVHSSELLNGSVVVINLNTGQVRTFETYSSLITSIAISPSGHYAYILGFSLSKDTYEINVINTSSETEVKNISLNLGLSVDYPGTMALSPNGSLAYVTLPNENLTRILNLSTGFSVGELKNENDPKYIAMDPNGSDILVTTGSDNVSEVNSSSGLIVKNFTGFNNPNGIALLSNGTYGYVLSRTDQSISRFIISEAYTVSFIEKGLPEGVEWYVNLSNGYFYKSTGSTISFTTSKNNYTYSIGISDLEYKPVHGYGNFIVNNSPLSLYVQFTSVNYTVTFKEAGLPSGTTWYVNLTNGMDSGTVAVTSFSFSLSNGSYSYKVSTSDKIYSPSPSSGSFAINGASVSEPIAFSKVTYKATFTESNLPAGSTWYVNMTGHDSGAITNTSYSFSLINGSYSYNIATTDKIYQAPPGSFTVNGASVSEPVAFSKVYTVTFTETGLPSGITWYVNLSNGQRYTSTASTISFTESNGTYSYIVSTTDKIFSPSPSSGSFTVNGASVSKSIAFSKVTYTVTFTEFGLPSRVEWYVNGSGLSGSAPAPSNISFDLANGSYVFNVTNLSNYYTTTYSFTVNIAGNNVTETVDYYRWAFITGTISPINTTLTINGKAVSLSSTGAFNVSVANGSYHVVASLSGYETYYRNFTLSAGNMENLTITLNHISKQSAISTTEIYAIIGAVVAIAVILGAVVYKRRK